MLDNLKLKFRVYSLDMNNIPKKDRLNITNEAKKFLLDNHKDMLDRELILYLKWKCLEYKILEIDKVSIDILTQFIYTLDLDKIYNIYKVKDLEYFLDQAKNYKCDLFIRHDDKYNSTFYAFIFDNDVYVCNDGKEIDEFE